MHWHDFGPPFRQSYVYFMGLNRFRNKIMKVNENIDLCGYSVQFLLILDNFCINRKLNLKKVSLYKPPPTPFRPCPAKQQGKILSFQLRGKTNRQMLCIKGGQKGDKNWWKHVRARYLTLLGILPSKSSHVQEGPKGPWWSEGK